MLSVNTLAFYPIFVSVQQSRGQALSLQSGFQI